MVLPLFHAMQQRPLMLYLYQVGVGAREKLGLWI